MPVEDEESERRRLLRFAGDARIDADLEVNDLLFHHSRQEERCDQHGAGHEAARVYFFN